MKNRFNPQYFSLKRQLISYISIALFLVLIYAFLAGIHSVSATTGQKQLESLETALSRNIIQCYSIEGIYPPSLEYLETHYGLVYNKELYFIDYQPHGANIMPEYTILPLTKNQGNRLIEIGE